MRTSRRILSLSVIATIAAATVGLTSVSTAFGALYFSGAEEPGTTTGGPAWGNIADYVAGDLTALGVSDWVTFGVSGTSPVTTNTKATGGGMLGPVVSSRTGYTGSKALFDHSSAVGHFDYTNGTSPVSATNANAGLGARRDTTWDNTTPWPRFDLTVPVIESDSYLYLWLIHSDSSIRIQAFDGSTQIGGNINFSISGDASRGRLVKLTFGGADVPDTLDIRVFMTSGSQDHSYLGIGGAALEQIIIPEPASLALLGGMALLIARRRR